MTSLAGIAVPMDEARSVARRHTRWLLGKIGIYAALIT